MSFNCIHSFKSWNTKYAGKVAGFTANAGYRNLAIDDKIHKVHNIVFLLVRGFLPKMLDHIDGNPANNRIENLRPANSCQNRWNARMSKRNAISGFTGVSWREKENKWRASIQFNYRMIQLGAFSDKKDAIKTRRDAELILYGEFASQHNRESATEETKEK